MEKFKGKPGPWVVYRGEVLTVDYEYDGQTMCDHICNCEEINGESPNANLIAAAPDLLDAVNLILDLQTRGFIVLGDKHTGTLQASVNRALGKINEDK